MKKTLCQVGLVFGFCAAVSAVAGPGLADGASKFVGNITQSNQAPAANSQFSQLWNQATAENGCKWGSVEGTRGKFSWSGCDAAYNWAKETGGHFKFHALVWGSQYPNWLNGLSVDETKKAITAWFDAVKKKYPEIEMIDVVNEAIRTGTNSYHSGYGKNNNIIPALGGDNNGDYTFVTTAFKMARERWPNAILIYNDYNTFQWQKNEGIELINTIKKNGAPVDAYGQQAHDMMSQGGGAGGTGGGGVCLNYTTFKNTLQEIYDKTQIPLFVSEYDISTTDDAVQKQCYQEQIGAFMEAPYVAGITLWGYIYGQTWTTNGESGIIRNGQDRPAMTWLKDYLSKNKGVNTTPFGGGVGGGFTSPSSVRVEEQTTAVTKLASSFEGTATFAIEGGDDAALFALSGADLAFKTAPSFASPSDANKDGTYKVKVKVTVGDKSASLEMSVIVTQKQGPYNGATVIIPGKIEAEAYDVCGEECGYHDVDTENKGDATIRSSDGVDLYENGTGTVVGFTQVGEWLEYTVNIESESATYKLKASVASGSDNSSFRLFIGDQAITDTVKVANGGDWDTYSTVEKNVTAKLTKGTHVIKLVITGDYVDIDWLELSDGTIGIGNSLRYNASGEKAYRIYNFKGAYVGTFKASDMTSLKNEVQKSNVKTGAYMVRSVDGQVNQIIQVKNK